MKEYKKIKEKFEELTHKISDPEIVADSQLFQKLAREHKEMAQVVEKINRLEKIQKEIKDNESLTSTENNEELVKFVQLDIAKLKIEKSKLEQELKFDLLPKDSNDSKNVIIEIRAGAGGDEAALFAEDLFKMYSLYAQKNSWAIEILSSSSQEIGGFKEIIFRIQGEGAYSKLKYESGVHRVQRIPKTEAKGRIHTSTATVAVLPEAEEIDLEIKPEETKIDVFRSSGPGGQSVNTTDSAVRITHLPTGMVVSCQDEKSQLKNKDKALKILRARLLAQKEEEEMKKRGAERKTQIGTGDRAEKIRTYNFPQSRITDHRINFTTHNLEGILAGNLDELIKSLESENQKRLLEK